MRYSAYYAHSVRPNFFNEYFDWNPSSYTQGEKVTSILTDKKIAEKFPGSIKNKNGVKEMKDKSVAVIYYFIPETHPYFNIGLMIFSDDFADDVTNDQYYRGKEITALRDLLANNISY